MDFCPSVYEHAARVVGKRPWEISRNAEALAEAHIRAFQLYEHSPVVIGVDIYNLEPEAYGAIIKEPSDNAIPAISTHPLCKVVDILTQKPLDPQRDGRIPMILEVGQRVAEKLPEANVRIPLSGPFSIACNLTGFDTLLCETVLSPGLVERALNHLVAGQVNFCREVIHRGLDIAFFESAAAPPLLSPQSFREVELEPLKKIIKETTEIVRHPVPCVIGGDTYPILDAIIETGTGYVICPCETNQAAFMSKMQDHPDVMVRINMDHRVLASTNIDEVYTEADRVISLAANRKKVCLGTGAIPYETKPEVILKLREYCRGK